MQFNLFPICETDSALPAYRNGGHPTLETRIAFCISRKVVTSRHHRARVIFFFQKKVAFGHESAKCLEFVRQKNVNAILVSDPLTKCFALLVDRHFTSWLPSDQPVNTLTDSVSLLFHIARK